VKRYATTHRGLIYVDVFSPMLGSNGRPRPELFVSDSLHTNSAGYAIWRRLLMPIVSDTAGLRLSR